MEFDPQDQRIPIFRLLHTMATLQVGRMMTPYNAPPQAWETIGIAKMTWTHNLWYKYKYKYLQRIGKIFICAHNIDDNLFTHIFLAFIGFPDGACPKLWNPFLLHIYFYIKRNWQQVLFLDTFYNQDFVVSPVLRHFPYSRDFAIFLFQDNFPYSRDFVGSAVSRHFPYSRDFVISPVSRCFP